MVAFHAKKWGLKTKIKFVLAVAVENRLIFV